MAIPNTQRIAIETLVERTGAHPIDLREVDRVGITLNGRPIAFCGVSFGRGSQSCSSAKVAVFYYGTIRTPVPYDHLGVPHVCDAAVLLRAPTPEERATRTPGTALEALDALSLELRDGAIQARLIGDTELYVSI